MSTVVLESSASNPHGAIPQGSRRRNDDFTSVANRQYKHKRASTGAQSGYGSCVITKVWSGNG